MYASTAHSNVTDLLISQVPQLLDQSSEDFRLLIWKLQNQIGQERLQLRQTTSCSDPDTCRPASVFTGKTEVLMILIK